MELVSTQASEKNDEYAGIDITVNVNTASSEELATLLVGVGEKKAKAIVEYRGEHGGFKQADDLIQVKGIGPALVEKNKARLRF
ncbi:MAG: ComEA family DNA-binding protein [Vibrio sp.]